VKKTDRGLIKAIEAILNLPLPGYKVQKRMEPSIRADLSGSTEPNFATRDSAVLILLYPFAQRLHFVLIKRQIYEGPHSGQVSLPGGKFEDIDLTLDSTALRETYEEVGVEPGKVRILGKLTELYVPVSNLMVYPYVGYTSQKPEFMPNLQEVEYVIEVGVSDLLAEANKSVKVITSHGRPLTAPFYQLRGEMVWGTTAMILAEFEEILRRI